MENPRIDLKMAWPCLDKMGTKQVMVNIDNLRQVITQIKAPLSSKALYQDTDDYDMEHIWLVRADVKVC